MALSMLALKHVATFFALSILFPFAGYASDISNQQKLEFKIYLSQIVAAEAITDPVQRCIAYPALPSIVWPKDHIEAHCRYHHEPAISLKQIQAMVSAREFDKLEAVFNELQMRHDAESNQSELIHRVYEYLQSADANNSTDLWLKHSPENAFALTARAEFLRGSAWRARGGKYASDTPDESLKSMSAFVQQAIPLYKKAIQLNPHIMQAYIGLLNVAMVDSESKIETEAMKNGLSEDDQCAEIFRYILTALQPRWGGKHELMQAFQVQYVLPSIPFRPLNAQYMATTTQDVVNLARIAGKTADELMPWVIKGLEFGANENLMDEAVRLYYKTDRYDLQHQYTSQIIRFRGGTVVDYGNMGNILLNFGFYEQGVRFIEKALELEPNNAFANYRLARYYRYTQKWGKAVIHAKVVKDNKDYGQDAMLQLTESLYFDKKPQEALPFAVEMTVRFPNAAESWGTRLMCEITLNRQAEAKESLKKLKPLLKPGDDTYQSLIQTTESVLRMAR